jgi:K(+)-stimulated pyrophosphate-energized sodium pump
MVAPGLIAILTPVAVGFLLGKETLGGMLLGATVMGAFLLGIMQRSTLKKAIWAEKVPIITRPR